MSAELIDKTVETMKHAFTDTFGDISMPAAVRDRLLTKAIRAAFFAQGEYVRVLSKNVTDNQMPEALRISEGIDDRKYPIGFEVIAAIKTHDLLQKGE